MNWVVEFHEAFLAEFLDYSEEIQNAISIKAGLLQRFGTQLGRPFVDTLSNSDYSNMKELRLSIDNGVWRIAFAFDPNRQAILLVAGDKKGKNQKQFYKKLIKAADERYRIHLDGLKKGS